MSSASRRPRFVVALCVAAVAMAAFEAVQLAVIPLAYYRETWIGIRLSGWTAVALSAIHIVLCGVVGAGLWRLKPWARWVAMIYLGYVLVSFLLLGVEAYRGGHLVAVMAWQMLVLPFVTFCFMYLQSSQRYFRD